MPASDKTTPTADQLEAVDNLITAMDLMEAHEWVGPGLVERVFLMAGLLKVLYQAKVLLCDVVWCGVVCGMVWCSVV